jgi:hypothetical protein
MNKRGMGWALTTLMSAGIIAMLFVGLYLTTGFMTEKEASGIKANIASLSTAGQARVIISVAADDIAQAKYDRIGPLVKEAYGPGATYALWVNDVRVSGQKIEPPAIRATAQLPTYDGKIQNVVLEVRQ